ncbi:hypothetical protein HWV62_45186 [Athelia sp. TMB]|nr:hypothetical protein HWV62_45186 [Athelia sp. TMB]
MEIITWLPLKSLIAAQGVDQHWRRLTSLAVIMPARRVLLNLYLQAIARDDITSLIASMRAQIHPFDRSSYVTALVTRNGGVDLPEEFRMWILEWPAGVMGWIWPGFEDEAPDTAAIMDTQGVNRLSYRYPYVEEVVIFEIIDAEGRNPRCEKAHVKALEICKRFPRSDWLVMSGTRQHMLGTVQSISAYQSTLEGAALLKVIEEMERFRCSGWVEWLSRQLRDTVDGQQ